MDDISEDESEKSQKIKNRMKSNIKNSLSNPIFSRLQHTSSAKNLAKLDIPKLKKKKFYSLSKRLSKSSANVTQFKNKIVNINQFYTYDYENIMNEQDDLMKEISSICFIHAHL